MSSQSKRVSSSEESGSESDEEETRSSVQPVQPKVQEDEDEEESEEGEEEESESDDEGEGFTTVRREGNLSAAGKVDVLDNPAGKRNRDANGGKEALAEEPANKKKRETKVVEKARIQPLKPASPVRADTKAPKAEVAPKGGKGPAPKVEKAKPMPGVKGEVAKAAAANRKRKASSPSPNGNAKPVLTKGESEKSPVKVKKVAHWTADSEIALATKLSKDKRAGLKIANTKNDSYWRTLLQSKAIPFEVTEQQLSEKVRRMKSRYAVLAGKLQAELPNPFRNVHEEKIYKLWEVVWGSGPENYGVRAVSSSLPEEEEEDEEGESDDEAATPPSKQTKITVGTAAPTKKEDEYSSSEEEEDEEENAKGKTGALNNNNLGKTEGKKAFQSAVVSPFVSKPLLEFTPHLPKDEKQKPGKKGEEGSRDEHGGGSAPTVEEFQGDGNPWKVDFLNSLKASCLEVMEEMKAKFLAAEEHRFGGIPGASELWRFQGLVPGIAGPSHTSAASKSAKEEMQKKWLKHRYVELGLMSQRLQHLQEQCKLHQEEMRMLDDTLGALDSGK